MAEQPSNEAGLSMTPAPEHTSEASDHEMDDAECSKSGAAAFFDFTHVLTENEAQQLILEVTTAYSQVILPSRLDLALRLVLNTHMLLRDDSELYMQLPHAGLISFFRHCKSFLSIDSDAATSRETVQDVVRMVHLEKQLFPASPTASTASPTQTSDWYGEHPQLTEEHNTTELDSMAQVATIRLEAMTKHVKTANNAAEQTMKSNDVTMQALGASGRRVPIGRKRQIMAVHEKVLQELRQVLEVTKGNEKVVEDYGHLMEYLEVRERLVRGAETASSK